MDLNTRFETCVKTAVALATGTASDPIFGSTLLAETSTLARRVQLPGPPSTDNVYILACVKKGSNIGLITHGVLSCE